jgi:repressor LexA
MLDTDSSDSTPSLEELTGAQKRVLEFIHSCAESSGSPPTLREICAHMGYSSIGSAQDMIQALRRKGFLENPTRQAARSFSLTEKARRVAGEAIGIAADVFSIPCLGAVPAGNPLEAVEERIDTIAVSPTIFSHPKPQPDRLFALRARGLSMIGAGILSGDWLIVKCQQEADRGEIVVARVDGEATVKRLERDGAGWFLQPENPDFQPIHAAESPFEIIGRVVALQRSI